MRPTIVLLASPQQHQLLLSRLQSLGTYQPGDVFDHLDHGGCRFGVDASGDVLRDYDVEELDEIGSQIDDVQAILIEYADVACIRELLFNVIIDAQGVLDTNYGQLLQFDAVVDRFTRDPSWDWRSG